MQTKLHQWAKTDPGRRFDDVFNLVYDPAFLVVAWGRVRSNKGARTAGVDGIAPRDVEAETVRDMLAELREDLKAHRFVPQMVRETTIPKASGKSRALIEGTRTGNAALRALATNTTKYVADTAHGPGWWAGPDEYGTFLAIPVSPGRTGLGILTLDALRPGDLAGVDRALIRLLASLLAAALRS
jgi:hypothetical protein